MVIFIWLSYGLYLYMNLPEIEITDKTYSPPSNNIDVDMIFTPLIPESKYLHKKKGYNNLSLLLLLALPVVYFEKFFSPQYQLCFKKLNYQVSLIEKTYNGGIWFSFLGFEYSIIGNYEEMMKKYKKLLNIENYPLNVNLVKKYYYNEKKRKNYSNKLGEIETKNY
jgi:hypothetical protein